MKQLSKEEMKNVVGGVIDFEVDDPGGGIGQGQCVLCHVNHSQQSCWYTNDSPDGLCSRVYPDGYTSSSVVDCEGCTMN